MYKDVLGGTEGRQPVDSLSTVKLTAYDANALTYEVNSPNGGVVVFSEIYYPGWQATVDGQPVEIACADYILRAIKVGPGKHTVDFKFDPKSLHVTETVANVSLVVLMLVFLGLAGCAIVRNRRREHREV